MTLSSESPTRHFWLALFSTAFTLALSGIVVGSAYNTFARQQLQTRQAQQQWQGYGQADCREMIREMPDDSVHELLRQPLVATCHEHLNQVFLAAALQYQRQSQHADAIIIAQQIQVGSELIASQQLIEQSSKRILDDAEDRYLSLDITGYSDAIRLANSLKPENPLFPEAQERIWSWQREWVVNQRHWETADQAMREGNFSLAEQAAKRISSHPFWLKHRSNLLTKIIADQKRCPTLY